MISVQFDKTQPLALSSDKWNHKQSPLEKGNDTENPSYLLHLHFNSEPPSQVRRSGNIKAGFFFLLVLSSSVSADGDFSVNDIAVGSRILVEPTLNIHDFLKLDCSQERLSTSPQSKVVFFFFRTRPRYSKRCSSSNQILYCSTAEVPLDVRKGPSAGLRLIKCGS